MYNPEYVLTIRTWSKIDDTVCFFLEHEIMQDTGHYKQVSLYNFGLHDNPRPKQDTKLVIDYIINRVDNIKIIDHTIRE